MEPSVTLTQSIGSALYMAPEVEGERPYSLPADVFSFGAVAFEMYHLMATGDNFYDEWNYLDGVP
jgi:serine/threonine protein kinase